MYLTRNSSFWASRSARFRSFSFESSSCGTRVKEGDGGTGLGRFALRGGWESSGSGDRGRFAVDEKDRVGKRVRGEPADINCGRERRFPSRGRRVRVAMMVMLGSSVRCFKKEIRQEVMVKKRSRKPVLERAGVRSHTVRLQVRQRLNEELQTALITRQTNASRFKAVCHGIARPTIKHFLVSTYLLFYFSFRESVLWPVADIVTDLHVLYLCVLIACSADLDALHTT